MDVGRSLLEQCLENPADDIPRHVYADWLEEQGSPIAELIRTQLAGGPADELIDRHLAEWVTPIFDWVPHPFFERGMLRWIRLPAATFARSETQALLVPRLARFGSETTWLAGPGDIADCEALAWTTRLSWRRPDDRSLAALATSPRLRFVHELWLDEPASIEPVLAVVEALSLDDLSLGGRHLDLARFTSSHVVRALQSLTLHAWDLGPIARAQGLSGLRHLAIFSHARESEEDLVTLLENPAFATLESMFIEHQAPLRDELVSRFRARFAWFYNRTRQR